MRIRIMPIMIRIIIVRIIIRSVIGRIIIGRVEIRIVSPGGTPPEIVSQINTCSPIIRIVGVPIQIGVIRVVITKTCVYSIKPSQSSRIGVIVIIRFVEIIIVSHIRIPAIGILFRVIRLCILFRRILFRILFRRILFRILFRRGIIFVILITFSVVGVIILPIIGSCLSSLTCFFGFFFGKFLHFRRGVIAVVGSQRRCK